MILYFSNIKQWIYLKLILCETPVCIELLNCSRDLRAKCLTCISLCIYPQTVPFGVRHLENP